VDGWRRARTLWCGSSKSADVGGLATPAFLVNHRKAIDSHRRGCRHWFGGTISRSFLWTPCVAQPPIPPGNSPTRVFLVTHLPPPESHVGGPSTTQDGSGSLQTADVFGLKAESDFWLSPEKIAATARPKDCANQFLPERTAIAAPCTSKARKVGTVRAIPAELMDGKCVGFFLFLWQWSHTPVTTGYELPFSSQGQKIPVLGGATRFHEHKVWSGL